VARSSPSSCRPAPRTRHEARIRAETLRAAVAAESGPWHDPITISIGVATFPDHAVSASTLAAAADAELYVAKNSGRNTMSVTGGVAMPVADYCGVLREGTQAGVAVHAEGFHTCSSSRNLSESLPQHSRPSGDRRRR